MIETYNLCLWLCTCNASMIFANSLINKRFKSDKIIKLRYHWLSYVLINFRVIMSRSCCRCCCCCCCWCHYNSRNMHSRNLIFYSKNDPDSQGAHMQNQRQFTSVQGSPQKCQNSSTDCSGDVINSILNFYYFYFLKKWEFLRTTCSSAMWKNAQTHFLYLSGIASKSPISIM